jgi:MFS family permease
MATTIARTSAFASRDFRRYYLGQTFSFVGDGLRIIAIPLLVFQLTGSAESLGLTYALELLPFALFSLVAGSLADRIDRRRTMIVCNVVRATIMVIFCAAFALHALSLTLLYTGVSLLAVCAAIFAGSEAPSIPYLLGKDGAKSGVSLLFGTEQATQLITPPVGAALFAIIGPLPALATNAVTYLVSQFAIASVDSFGPDTPSGLPDLREIAADVVAGTRFILTDRVLRPLTLAQFWINLFGIMGFAAVIPYLKREFGASDHVIGLAFAALSLGAVAGASLSARVHWRFGYAQLAMYFLDGLFWSTTIWTHDVRIAIAGMALAAACGTYAVTASVSWRMRVTPEDLVGRVFGVARLVVVVGMVPGSLIGGWISDHLGTRMTMGVSMAGYFALVAVLACLPALRAERR